MSFTLIFHKLCALYENDKQLLTQFGCTRRDRRMAKKHVNKNNIVLLLFTRYSCKFFVKAPIRNNWFIVDKIIMMWIFWSFIYLLIALVKNNKILTVFLLTVCIIILFKTHSDIYRFSYIQLSIPNKINHIQCLL